LVSAANFKARKLLNVTAFGNGNDDGGKKPIGLYSFG
jgi:hypothetical protein